MPAPRSTLRHTLTVAGLAALAAGLTWFALCFWYQSVFASLHRIVRNGSQSAADVLDWRYNLLIASGGEVAFDWEACTKPSFHDMFYPTSQRLWPHAAQSAAVVGAGAALLFSAVLLLVAASGQSPLRSDADRRATRCTLALGMFAGISSAAIAWYAAVPRLALFSTSYLPDPVSLPAILAASGWHLVVIGPLVAAVAAASAAQTPSPGGLVTSDRHTRLCPYCGYNAQHFQRCPECGLPSNRFRAFTRARILRLLAIPTCTLMLLAISATLLSTFATDPRTTPLWALRASVWIRLRHPELLVSGQHIFPKFELVTQVTLANGDRWDILPFVAQATTAGDLANTGPGGGFWAYMVTRIQSIDPPDPHQTAVVGFLPAAVHPPWQPASQRYMVRLSDRADHPDQAIVGTIRLDARVTSLSTRPMRPLDFTQQPPPSDSSIEAQLARTLAERKWIWYPAIPKP